MFYLGRALKVALLSMGEEQLGSYVMYRGRKCFISNWSGGDYPTLADGTGFSDRVPREEITSIMNASELLHRFRFGFSFYMTNWHGIDVSRGVYGRSLG